MSTIVYGSSDDQVVCDGDVDGQVDKYAPTQKHPVALDFSDGTVLYWYYAKDGLWKVIVDQEGSLFDHVKICEEETEFGYSDIVFFKDGLQWATYNNENVC